MADKKKPKPVTRAEFEAWKRRVRKLERSLGRVARSVPGYYYPYDDGQPPPRG